MSFDVKKLRIGSFFFSMFGIVCLAMPTLANEVLMAPVSHVGAMFRVKTVVEVAGSLTIASKTGESSAIPMSVDAEMFYDERGLAADGDSVRHYWNAKVDFKVDGNERTTRLRKDRNLITLSGESFLDRYASGYGPLTREELELLDVPGSAFPPEQLLPGEALADEPIQKESSWKINATTAAQLLRIEKLTKGDLIAEISSINDEEVKVSISGSIEGQVEGVATRIEVVGNYLFDREARIVKWLALALKEKREVGFSAPGFEVTTRIRTARQAIDSSQVVSKNALKNVPLRRTAGDQLLGFVANDNLYRMVHDRRWHLISARESTTQMRMVDSGDLLATCKIDLLNRSVPGKQVRLEAFRDDVQSALAKNCKQIVSASQKVNGQGVRIMRVEADGAVAETPIRWIYYHLSDDSGQRLSFIFTLEASQMDRFSGIDEAITSSVAFLTKEERQARVNSKALK